jgi:hypothetical protein
MRPAPARHQERPAAACPVHHSPTLPGTFALLSQRIDRGTTCVQGKGTVGITKAQADQIIADLRAD